MQGGFRLDRAGKDEAVLKRWLRMVMMFSVFLIVYSALNLYVGWNLSLFLEEWQSKVPLGLFWTGFGFVAFSYVFARIKRFPPPVRRFLRVIGSYYIGLFEYLVLLLPVADLAGWVLKSAGYRQHYYLLLVGGVTSILLIVLFIRGSWNAWVPIVRTYDVTIKKNAGKLDQLTIAVASDLHLGSLVGNRHLERLIRVVEAMNPDLILLPGDVIDEEIEPFNRNRMGDRLKRLQARLGTFAVLGNHEYYGGHLEEYVGRMGEIGIPVLQDEAVQIEDAFYLVGRKDRTAESFDPDGRKEVSELTASLDPALPILLMDHQPYHYDRAEAAGVDLLLSGHTHRGQLAPNHWLTKRLFELDWGFLKKGTLHAVVSSGFGTWGPPVRLASRSEIVRVNVRFAPGKS